MGFCCCYSQKASQRCKAFCSKTSYKHICCGQRASAFGAILASEEALVRVATIEPRSVKVRGAKRSGCHQSSNSGFSKFLRAFYFAQRSFSQDYLSISNNLVTEYNFVLIDALRVCCEIIVA